MTRPDPPEVEGATASGDHPRWWQVLRAVREARGVTQEGWAARLKVGARTVQRWERGERPPDELAEAAILAYCGERGLFRPFEYGPLHGRTLTAAWLSDLLAEARLNAAAGSAPPSSAASTGDAAAAMLRVRDTTTPPPGTNLPVPLTRFIGRGHEQVAVQDLLSLRSTRLLTLTGPGGVGKTRLALAVARELTAAYREGVWLVELAPLADEQLVPQVVAAVLGVREQPGRPLVDVLATALASRQTLVVLDNCEHLVAACAQLAASLLGAAPGLRILATSREPLGSSGETIYRVPALALPAAPSTTSEPEDLTQYDAVELFVDRARAALPAFAVTRANAGAIADVCRRLDGMPLALELAAAWVAVLTPEQIAARLDDRFRLLTGGRRTALPRHQTLRAALDWSYELLSEPEQTLLRRLTVFAGGWTVEATEAVCGGDGLASAEMLGLLARLVATSLVQAEVQGREGRYRLLETVRAYAQEAFAAAGEPALVRQRHAAYYLALAEAAAPQLRGPHQVTWIEQLTTEHDNLRAALAWTGDQPGEDVGLRLAGALAWFWHMHTHLTEGRRWLTRALAQDAARRPTRARAKALFGAGSFAWQFGDTPATHASFAESRAICDQIGDAHGLAYALGGLAMAAGLDDDRATWRAQTVESMALLGEQGDTWGRAWFGVGLGLAALRDGDLTAAQAHLEECRTLYEQVGDRWAAAIPQWYLALLASRRHDHASARVLLEQVVAIHREMGDRGRMVEALYFLSYTTVRLGDHEQAWRLLAEGLAVSRALGSTYQLAQCLAAMAGLAGAMGQPERGARLFGAADALHGVGSGKALPQDRLEFTEDIAAVRAQLGTTAFEEAWAAGQALPVEQAIAEALSVVSV